MSGRSGQRGHFQLLKVPCGRRGPGLAEQPSVCCRPAAPGLTLSGVWGAAAKTVPGAKSCAQAARRCDYCEGGRAHLEASQSALIPGELPAVTPPWEGEETEPLGANCLCPRPPLTGPSLGGWRPPLPADAHPGARSRLPLRWRSWRGPLLSCAFSLLRWPREPGRTGLLRPRGGG